MPSRDTAVPRAGLQMLMCLLSENCSHSSTWLQKKGVYPTHFFLIFSLTFFLSSGLRGYQWSFSSGAVLKFSWKYFAISLDSVTNVPLWSNTGTSCFGFIFRNSGLICSAFDKSTYKSDRSPRRGDLVRACVRASVPFCKRTLKMSSSSILESRGAQEGAQEAAQEGASRQASRQASKRASK